MNDAIPRGAVDLSALAAQREARHRAANAPAAPAGLVKDVTTESFGADVIEQSMTVPVVIDLWADWCEPCKTLSPLLESMVTADGGRWILAKIDVDAEQQIAQAFQVQSIPSVFGVIKGQPVPLFQGALPEPQLRQYIDALLAEAQKNGITGTAGQAAEPQAEPEPPLDPMLDAAHTAMERADWDAARTGFGSYLEQHPADAEATRGLATAQLYSRAVELDADQVLAEADESPDDVDLRRRSTDCLAVAGRFDEAFNRLIDGIRVSAGDDRSALREHLLGLFDVCGPDHPAVAKARMSLANALF